MSIWRRKLKVTPDEIVFEDNPEAFEAELFAKNGIKAEYLVENRNEAQNGAVLGRVQAR